MNRKHILIFLIFSSTLFGNVYAQSYVSTPVEISTEKANIGGSIFYIHTVLQGQTLFSIAKTYGVSTGEIGKHNPKLSEGLKTGSILYIPVSPTISTSASNISELRKEMDNSYKAPENEGQKERKIRKHTVKWYETIFDIAQKYDVNVDDILYINNLEKGSVLKRKQVILIPDKNFDPIIMEGERIVAKPETESKVPETTPQENKDDREHLYSYSQGRNYKASLVLPLNASRSTENPSVNQIDFYSGALLAMQALKTNISTKYTLDIVDIGKYHSVNEMINSGILNNSDLIIGPIVDNNITPVAEFAKNNKIPIVSPMDLKTSHLLKNNPYFILFPSTPESGMAHLLSSVVKQDSWEEETITLVFEKGYENSSAVLTIKEYFRKHSIEHKVISYPLLEGRNINAHLKDIFIKEKLNKVIVASESEAFVSDVLRNLHLIKSIDLYNIEVFGQPKWKSFETLETEYLHLLNTHLFFQYFVDYNNPATKEFVRKYREIFKAEPTPYSFQGYDIVYYFISSLEKYGRSFPNKITKEKATLLQSDVKFNPASNDAGLENIAIRSVRYGENWEILLD